MTADVTDEPRNETDCRTTHAPATDSRFAVPLRGVAVDGETRCRHWHSTVDVLALRFDCCGTYYPCAACHAETTDHDSERLPRDRFDERAVLCGRCHTPFSAETYLGGGDSCPSCGAAFNPGCRDHHHLYFRV